MNVDEAVRTIVEMYKVQYRAHGKVGDVRQKPNISAL